MKLVRIPAAEGAPYVEFLRSPHLSVGVYRLSAGARDPQRPHTEDEVYYVLRGRARFTASGRTVPVAAGECIFVAAGEEHRFHDIEEDLELLVVFGPSEGSRA